MRALLATLLLAASPSAFGAETATVRRGDFVKAAGLVLTDGVFRLKSTIDGRIENVSASSFTWQRGGAPLATLAQRELAAMLDAKGAQEQDQVEDRWRQAYRPTRVVCPDDCYVLKVYARAHAWTKPSAVLFEAARGLKMLARVSPEDAPLMSDGMIMTYWLTKDPAHRLKGRVTKFARDARSGQEEPGGTFVLEIPRELIAPPGTEWEGEALPEKKRNMLMVPSASLIHLNGAAYLPIRVSTGVERADFTQIVSGVDEKEEFLILNDAQLKAAETPRQEAARKPLARPAQTSAAPAKKETVAPAEMDDAVPTERPVPIENDKGEDPYGEQ